MAGGLLIIGMILMGIGGIWMIVLAFQESAMWGLGVLFIPFIALFFVITHFQEAKVPFFLELGGVGCYIAAIMMSPEMAGDLGLGPQQMFAAMIATA